MKTGLTTKYFVAHELVGGEDKRKELLATLKSGKEVPDTLEITGVLMDDSKNMNNWQVPEGEFDGLIESLKQQPYLKDHNETVDSVAGQVTDVWREGNVIKYKAEIDDTSLIKKILRGRVKFSSVQIDSDLLICSKCYEDVNNKELTAEDSIAKGEYYSRKDGDFTHLHSGAHEVVLHPEGKEISAVVFPAYKIAEMGPALGFKAALDRALSKPELRSTYNLVGKDGDVTERDASDIKQRPKTKVRVLSEEESKTTLTAEKIAEAVTTAMEAHRQKVKAQEESEKMQESYKTFLNTWEGAIGKIGELEKNYNAATTKLEDILTKYEDIVKQQDEVSKAGRTLREARKQQPPVEEEEGEEKPIEAKKRQDGEEDEKIQEEEEVKEQDEEVKEQNDEETPKASRKGKAVVGKADEKGSMLRTGLDSKYFPEWYKEIISKARKHPRREA